MLRRDASGLLWLGSPGLPEGPECGDDALAPLHPSLFTPPHSWSCQVSWLGGAHKAQVESPVGGTRKECLANGKGWGVQLRQRGAVLH